LPRLHAFQDDYGPHGYTSMPINLSDGWDVIKQYARQYASLYLKDDGSFYATYRQNGYVPLNYVIDTAGIVRYVAEGWNENAVRQVIEQYLPDQIEHDVGVTRLMAPTGSPDSGTVIVPACSLYNYRSYAETYPVRMRIGTGYDEVVTVTNHGPAELICVEFPAWTALARGQAAVTCTTELASDDIGSNNAARTTVTVNVDDIAVSAILVPADTAELGRGVVPAAEVKNLGTLADMAKVRFYIGDFYVDSVNVPLQPGKTDTAVFDVWTPALLGTFPVRCTSATLKTDLVTTNNELSTSVVVQPASIAEQPSGIARFVLLGSSQNPARAHATIRYSLAETSPVDLRIFSATGELVRVLETGIRQPGLHRVLWDGRDELGRPVGRGTWFCRMTAGAFQAVSKMTTIE
jgi:hypothetical protein